MTYLIPAIVGVIGLGGVAWLIFSGDAKSKQTVEVVDGASSGMEASGEVSQNENLDTLPVYVAGAVNNPGVYWVGGEALVGDAIELAGGFSSECDLKTAELSLNLADKVTSGMKIYVPRIGDQPVVSNSTGVSAQTNDGKININNASKTELMSLSGIGEVYSEKIISARPYKAIEELASKGVVPNATYEKIKENIKV